MKFTYLAVFITLLFSAALYSQDIDTYFNTIKKEGKEPVSFLNDLMTTYDLVLCDDALHAAVEPFEFYADYLGKHPESVDYVFLEVFSITSQASMDAFLNAKTKNISLLAKAFQQDFRYGWPYETYLTFFSKVWDINQKLPDGKQIRIIGTDQPIYWEALHSREDYNQFQQSLTGRDYFMYKMIAKYMENFETRKKGLFLTNTRHAYKGIKNKNGQFYWNAGTFLAQWHPAKTYSIRFHNMNLYIESVRAVENSSTEGLDKLNYKWVKMDDGLWDEAFEKNGNKAVAIPLKNNAFGNHPYIGNHMAKAAENQTMYDAYDAVIFLKPLEQTKFSAQTNFFYTDEFKKELRHRVRVINEGRLDDFLRDHKVESIDEFIENLAKYKPESANPLVPKQN